MKTPLKINWEFPDLNQEFNKIKVQSVNLNIDYRSLFQSLKNGKIIRLNNSMWSQLENTESFGIENLSQVKKFAMSYNKAFNYWFNRIKHKLPIPMPMVYIDDDKLYLIGGDIRLMIAKALKMIPYVLVADFRENKQRDIINQDNVIRHDNLLNQLDVIPDRGHDVNLGDLSKFSHFDRGY